MSFLRVMTYNIHGGADRLGRPSLTAAAATIRAIQPTLTGLQEVERGFRRRSGLADQPARLAADLGLDQRFGPAIDRAPGTAGGKFGQAILSARPVISSWNMALPSGREPRGLLGVKIETPDGPLNFLTCHLGLDPVERAQQVMAVLSRAGSLAGPVILTGDFNAPPNAPEIAPLFSSFTEAQTAMGSDQPTFSPSGARIDFIFIPPDWRVERVEVVPSPASDHCPLVADVEPGGAWGSGG